VVQSILADAMGRAKPTPAAGCATAPAAANARSLRLSLADLVLREEPTPDDPERVRQLIASTAFFHSYEIPVAVELVEDRLAKGAASDYSLLFAEHDGRLAGYACYGEIACTEGSYDLYWIAVHPDYQGRGLGRVLLRETEARIRACGGARLYIETSGRPLYQSTRGFYERCEYRLEATLEDFYGPGDAKVIYARALGASS
jgi:ribosomal protein S18 acetylase RimI-like enzyme